MRIAFLSTSGHLGGAEAVLREIMSGLRQAKPAWRLGLIAPADGGLVTEARALEVDTRVLPYPPVLARWGEFHRAPNGEDAVNLHGSVPLFRLPALGLGAVVYARRLRAMFHAWRPDVIHANGLKMDILAAGARPRGTALVWHIHDFLGSRPTTSRLLRGVAGRCAAAVANSKSVAADARAVLGERVGVTTIYNAVDLDRFAPDGPVIDLDARANLPATSPDTIKVGLVATLAWWKGHELFLEAIRRAPDDLPLRAYVIGGPIYETGGSQRTLEELRQIASTLGLGARVAFTGFVDQPAAAMRALDIVVHASTEPEPFGLVIAEAMACGRPVIVSQTGGAAEIVENETTGLTFPPGDAGQLAERITRLARCSRLRDTLGRAARVSAARRFDRARLARELVPLYERVART